MYKFKLIIVLLLFCAILSAEESGNLSKNKPAIESTKYFDINRITCSIRNDGIFARHPITGNSDLQFDDNPLIYTSGLWIATSVNGEIRASAADFNTDWIGGAIDDQGNPYGKEDSTFRVYKISRGDNAANNPDYFQWPIALGAPSDGQGNPFLIGDQTLWCSFTDAYVENRGINICPPLGAEIHLTVWGWEEIDNVIFLRWNIINKSDLHWNDAYVGIYSDPDVMDASNDLTGSDSTLNLAYCYDDLNPYYDFPFHSVGYQLLESPIVPSPGDTAISFFEGTKVDFRNVPIYSPRIEKHSTEGWGEERYKHETTATVIYNRLHCLNYDELPAIDPTTNRPTKWAYSGDPLLRTGWIDEIGRDRRMMLSMGPLDLVPGDTTSFILAALTTQNDCRLGNVTDLNYNARAMQNAVKYGAGLYSETGIATKAKHNFEAPIRLLNFQKIEEIQFTVQYDTSEIEYNRLMLAERTASCFTLDSNLVADGKIEYNLKSNVEEHLSIGNDPIAYLKFDIREGILEKFVSVKLIEAICLPDSGKSIPLNNAECLVKIEKRPAPPRLLTPLDGECVNDLAVHFSWTKTQGSDPNIYRFESEWLNKTVEDTCFSYPLINFIRRASDQNSLNWTVGIFGYSQNIPSPDTFQFQFPTMDELDFTQYLYNCQLPFDSTKSEKIYQIAADENFIYLIQSYKPNPNSSTVKYHFLIVKIEDTEWHILSDQEIYYYSHFIIKDNKAFFKLGSQVAAYFVDENKVLHPRNSFDLEELVMKMEIVNNLLIIYGGKSDPKIFIYQISDDLTELTKLSELNLKIWHNSVYYVGAKWIVYDHFIFLFFTDWGVLTDWGIIDFGNPQSPQIVNHLPDTTGAVSFLVDNNKLYTSTENHRINIYDISDLKNPQLIHSENLGQKLLLKKISGNDIYATSGDYLYKFGYHPGQHLKFDGLLEYTSSNPLITDRFVYKYSGYDNLIYVYKNMSGTGLKLSRMNEQRSFQLHQNYPNPFNPTTTIKFSIDKPAKVSLKIYNIQGQLVRILVDEFRHAGQYNAVWDGTNQFGQHVSSGLFFYQLKPGDRSTTKKMLLLK